MVQVAVDRHSLLPLPALDGGHVALEVGRDFLPRVKPFFRHSLGRLYARKRFTCGVLLHGQATAGERCLILPLGSVNGKGRHLTANTHSAHCRLTVSLR